MGPEGTGNGTRILAPRTTCCHPPLRCDRHRRQPQLRPTAPGGTRGQTQRPHRDGWVRSVFWRDAQADVPSAERPRAQLAFKNSMVHGILQFTPGIAFCYVLHRCESRDIRCRESCGFNIASPHGAPPARRLRPRARQFSCSLTPYGAVGSFGAPPLRRKVGGLCTGRRVPAPPPGGMDDMFAVCFGQGHDNDPSAGSPTETLLRLLLPLNDKVQWTSRDVGGGEPPPSPRSEHFTGPFNR